MINEIYIKNSIHKLSRSWMLWFLFADSDFFLGLFLFVALEERQGHFREEGVAQDVFRAGIGESFFSQFFFGFAQFRLDRKSVV